MSTVEIVVTGPTDWMKKCVADLVDVKLIACSHLWLIESSFWWNDQVQHDQETRAAMHTTGDLAEAVVDQIKSTHPYEVSCVCVVAIESGNPDYLSWVERVVSGN